MTFSRYNFTRGCPPKLKRGTQTLAVTPENFASHLAAAKDSTPDACAGRGDPKLFSGDTPNVSLPLVRFTDVIFPVFVNTTPLCF